MPKKIYDILPPKVAHKFEKEVKAFLNEDGGAKKKHKTRSHKKEKKRFPLREILVGGSVIIILLAIYVISKLPKAEIQIWPKVDSFNIQEKVTADKSFSEIDLASKVIPARYIEQDQEGQQEFPSTGLTSNDSKASGVIKVYNKISPSEPFTLKAGTHFVSDSGKYFVSVEKVVIPSAQKGKAGSVNVKVQAQEAGMDYNIGAAKWSVPKLSGTAFYYSIWGESSGSMSGGYTGKLKKVTKDDILEAKDLLTKKLSGQAEDLLKKKIASDEVLFDEAISNNVADFNCDAKPDSIADKFNESMKVTFSALVFKKQDLEELVKDDISSKLSDSQSFLEKTLKLNYNPDLVDVQGGKETINLQSSVNTYYKVDNDNVIDLAKRKSDGNIEDIISQMYGEKISKVKVNFWPFWVKKAPSDGSRIKIKLNFE